MFNFRLSNRSFATRAKNYVDGEWVSSTGRVFFKSKNPLDQKIVRTIPQTTKNEFDEAVSVAKSTFSTWKEVSVPQRVRCMLEYQKLLKDNTEELAGLITLEHGKTLVDARGDVFRGIEVVESTSNYSSLLMGETMENLSSGVDSYSYRHPLGV